MLHFNNLDYYAIPSLPTNFKAPTWLKIELGIFSGRLYFEWDEYDEMLQYFGAPPSASLNKSAQPIERKTFAKKPLTFLHEWLAIRRKGQDFEHTPMGFITTGKPLTQNHPFFSSPAAFQATDATTIATNAVDVEEEDVVEEIDEQDSDDESLVGEGGYQQVLEDHDEEAVFYDAVDHFETKDE
ncbi:hypothetical protein P280DRAFT_474819 [Massarina eburnea CBS 473.64]|uniref:Uncharacterized protein n=1 Tax=Massarina eburnea CBS 473.64 TaxID=1395130 RepID=A0A6A6RGS9_9PLEO|nr:hypothetical protein P280DRAFT_474819 [Massarina eburnea CBS 473.64]